MQIPETIALNSAKSSVNIHSHAIGSALFAWLPFHFYTTVYQEVQGARPIDAVLFTVYFLAVAACFACSAWYARVPSPHELLG